MADDITLNAGSGGSIVSTEQLTSGGDSSHAQRIKIINGAAHTDGGDVTPANPFPIAIEVSGSPVDPRAVRALTSSDVVTAAQGTAAGLGGAWPVELTDGTHTMPTADAAARALFAEITDGTHTLPTGDAVARSINVQVNDGTNVLGTTAHPEIVAGAGVAGTPAGGVVSVQGVSSGTPVPSSDAIVVGSAFSPTEYGANATVSAFIKASPGNLFSIYVTNRNAAIRYLILWNLSAPGSSLTGQVGCSIAIYPGTSILIGTDFFKVGGWNFSTGISWGISTSNTSYVAATAADHDVMASYA